MQVIPPLIKIPLNKICYVEIEYAKSAISCHLSRIYLTRSLVSYTNEPMVFGNLGRSDNENGIVLRNQFLPTIKPSSMKKCLSYPKHFVPSICMLLRLADRSCLNLMLKDSCYASV